MPNAADERGDRIYQIGPDDGWSGVELPHDDIVAPLAIQPAGARYEFDPEQNYVKWSEYFNTILSNRPYSPVDSWLANTM